MKVLSKNSKKMARYKIQIKHSVEKDISAYDKNIKQRLIEAIYTLQINPYKNSKKLQGTEFYRKRVGNYRIVFEVIKKDSCVIIYKIGHRKNIYK